MSTVNAILALGILVASALVFAMMLELWFHKDIAEIKRLLAKIIEQLERK